MAPIFKRYGVSSIFYFAAVVVALVLTMPYFFNHQGSDYSEQIKSALDSNLSIIHAAGEQLPEPEIPVSRTDTLFRKISRSQFKSFHEF